MNDKEKLLVIEAMAKVVDEASKDLKGAMREEILGKVRDLGAMRYAEPLTLNGQTLGSATVSFTKNTVDIDFAQKEAALDYLERERLTERVPAKGWEKRFAMAGDRVYDTVTGEFCPFLAIVPAHAKTVAFKVDDPQLVLREAQSMLPNGIVGLLGGDE